MKHRPGPSVDAGHLVSIVPGTGVGALTLGTGADAVTVCFALFPASAVCSTIVKIESAAVDMGPGGRARGGGGRGGAALHLPARPPRSVR